MDKYTPLIHEETVRAKALASAGVRINNHYVSIFQEKMKIAEILTSQSKELQSKAMKFSASLTLKEQAQKFNTHMQTIVLPAIATYQQRSNEIQTVFRQVKPKTVPKKKGPDPTKIIAEFDTRFAKHTLEQAMLLKEILRHLANAELYLHTSQIEPLTGAFQHLSAMDPKVVAQEILPK